MVQFTDTLSASSGAMTQQAVAQPADNSLGVLFGGLSRMAATNAASSKDNLAREKYETQKQANSAVNEAVRSELGAITKLGAEGKASLTQGTGNRIEYLTKLSQKMQELNSTTGGAYSAEISKAFVSTVGFDPNQELNKMEDKILDKQIDQQFAMQSALQDEAIKGNIPMYFTETGELDYTSMQASAAVLNASVANANMMNRQNKVWDELQLNEIEKYTGSLAVSELQKSVRTDIEPKDEYEARFRKALSNPNMNSPEEDAFARNYVKANALRLAQGYEAGLDAPLSTVNKEALVTSIERSYSDPMNMMLDMQSPKAMTQSTKDYLDLLKSITDLGVAEEITKLYETVPTAKRLRAIDESGGGQAAVAIAVRNMGGDSPASFKIDFFKAVSGFATENIKQNLANLTPEQLRNEADVALRIVEGWIKEPQSLANPEVAQQVGTTLFRLMKPASGNAEDVGKVSELLTRPNAIKVLDSFIKHNKDPELSRAVLREMHEFSTTLHTQAAMFAPPAGASYRAVQDSETGVVYIETDKDTGEVTEGVRKARLFGLRKADATVVNARSVHNNRGDIDKYLTAVNSLVAMDKLSARFGDVDLSTMNSSVMGLPQGSLKSVYNGDARLKGLTTITKEGKSFYLPTNGVHNNLLDPHLAQPVKPVGAAGGGGGIFGAMASGISNIAQGITDPMANVMDTIGQDPMGDLIANIDVPEISGNKEVDEAIVIASEQAGVPQEFVTKLVKIESNFNPNAKNKSGASGLFQFMPKTAAAHGLDDPTNPKEAAIAFADFTLMNKRVLSRRLGREPKEGELYLAHQQGAGGASALLTANPKAKAADILKSTKKVTQNGGKADMTVKEFVDMWQSKYDSI